jgi:ABC-2 type transport system permease protein
VWLEVGATTIPGAVDFPPAPFNLSVDWQQTDLARAGYRGDLFFHATDGRGDRIAGAALLVNGTEVARTDANGFVHTRLAPGHYLVNVTRGADRQEFDVTVLPGTAIIPALSGPNSLLAFLALAVMGLLLPIFAIAMSYDSIAKERFTGSMDLLLIRPVSRAGIAVGKFLGTWTAVAIPTVVVALGGVAAVEYTSGRGADAGFVAAFLLGSLFLIAAYVLIMQILSTLMRTPGTAVLAALIAWFTFEFLWSVVFLLVTAGFGIGGGTEAYFIAQSVTNLTNPGGVYSILIGAALPADVTFGQGSAYGLPPWAGAVAGIVWIAILLPLAVWTFVKRAPR